MISSLVLIVVSSPHLTQIPPFLPPYISLQSLSHLAMLDVLPVPIFILSLIFLFLRDGLTLSSLPMRKIKHSQLAPHPVCLKSHPPTLFLLSPPQCQLMTIHSSPLLSFLSLRHQYRLFSPFPHVISPHLSHTSTPVGIGLLLSSL